MSERLVSSWSQLSSDHKTGECELCMKSGRVAWASPSLGCDRSWDKAGSNASQLRNGFCGITVIASVSRSCFIFVLSIFLSFLGLPIGGFNMVIFRAFHLGCARPLLIDKALLNSLLACQIVRLIRLQFKCFLIALSASSYFCFLYRLYARVSQ